MASKRILITGVTGFVGRHLVKVIRERMPDVDIVGAARRGSEGLCRGVTVDCGDAEAVLALIDRQKPDIIIHLVASPTARGWDEGFRHNVAPGVHILEAIKTLRARVRVVMVGSAAEYGTLSKLPADEACETHPVSEYGVMKLWQTQAARFYADCGVDVMVGRIFNLLGRDSPEYLSVGSFSAQLRSLSVQPAPRRLLVGNLDAKRDYLDVRDACAALLAIALRGARGEIYNVCSGRPVVMKAVVDRMIQAIGAPVEIVVDPSRLRPNDVVESYGTHEKITKVAGWKPEISFDDSVAGMFPLSCTKPA